MDSITTHDGITLRLIPDSWTGMTFPEVIEHAGIKIHYMDETASPFWYISADLRRTNDEDNYTVVDDFLKRHPDLKAKDDSESATAFINMHTLDDARKVAEALTTEGLI
jgi:hypothetical protein